MRFYTRYGTIVLALLAVTLVAAPLAAQDDDGDEGTEQEEVEGAEENAWGDDEGYDEGDDELEGEQEAEEEGEEEEEEGETRRRRRRLRPSPSVGLHPTYRLTHTRDQDVASWGHIFDLSYPITGRIGFKASSKINVRENRVLDRKNRNENWNAGIDYALTNAVDVGLKFNRVKQSDVRHEGRSNEVRSFREKESVALSSGYRKTHFDGVSTSASVSAGLEKNRYADVESTGSSQSVSGSLKYDPLPTLKTDFRYSGRHSLLDSKQGDLESTDESVSHSLDGRVSYDWGRHAVSVDIGRSVSEKEYPKEGQTERHEQNDRSVSANCVLNVVEGLSTRVGFDYSWNRSLYRVESSKDSEIAGRSVNSSLTYTMGSTSLGAELKSEKKRNEYFNFQTGDIYHKTFGASLQHTFGPRFDATLRGRTSLLSYHYDDIEENDQDRDLFDQEASLNITYSPAHDMTAGLLVRVRENQLIYIRRARSGDNKTTQTYTVQPSLTKNFTRQFSVGQKYELSADYTFYSYDRDSNFLIRGLAVTTDVAWKPFSPLTLHVDHKYSSRDEGAYVEDESGAERYGKNREREDHGITVRVQYKLFGAINIEASQSFNVKRNWSFHDGEREFDWERFDKSFSIKAGSERKLPNGSTLKFSVGKTLRDATSINERQRDVWNITLNLDRTF